MTRNRTARCQTGSTRRVYWGMDDFTSLIDSFELTSLGGFNAALLDMTYGLLDDRGHAAFAFALAEAPSETFYSVFRIFSGSAAVELADGMTDDDRGYYAVALGLLARFPDVARDPVMRAMFDHLETVWWTGGSDLAEELSFLADEFPAVYAFAERHTTGGLPCRHLLPEAARAVALVARVRFPTCGSAECSECHHNRA